MKILLAGDLHSDLKHFRRLLDVCRYNGCGRIFFLGDFNALEHTEPGVEFFDHVSSLADAYEIDVYFLDGNHDKTSLLLNMYDDGGGFFLTVRPRLFYAPRGLTWWWGGKKFIALGGAYSVDKNERLKAERAEGYVRGVDLSGTRWFPEEEMTDAELDYILHVVCQYDAQVDIMLTHDKPRGANPRWYRRDIPETWPNQDRIHKAMQTLGPRLLVHGHLHFPYVDHVRHGRGWTRVVGLDANPDYATRPDPKWSYMVLDTDALA